MNKVEQIKYIMELEEEKENLERKLSSVNEEFKSIRNICSHINVNLGYYGIYPSTGDEYCCLLCGMEKNREYYYPIRNNMVYAKSYLPRYDIKDDKQCIEKFEHIRTLALGILKEDPDMTEEELVSRLNALIKDSITISQNPAKNNGLKLVKKHQKK